MDVHQTEESQEQLRYLWAENDFRDPQKIDPRDTLANSLLPKAISVSLWKFWVFPGVSLASVFAWATGFFLAAFTLAGQFPTWVSWLSFASFPCLLFNTLFLNRGLLKHLLRCFELYYLVAMLTGFIASYIILFRGDERSVCMFNFGWSLLFIILVDAHHPATKRSSGDGINLGFISMTVCIFIGDAGLGAILLLSHLDAFPNLYHQSYNVSLGAEPMEMDVSVFGNRCAANLLIFFTKNLVNAIIHPESYLMISARVTHEKSTEDALRQKSSRRRFSVSTMNVFTGSGTFRRSSRAVVPDDEDGGTPSGDRHEGVG